MSLTRKEHKKCGSIIHLASGAAALVGSGMAQIPLSDAVLLVPIQTKMLTAIGKVFEVDLTESAAKGFCAALAATCIGRSVSQVCFGWIPFIGNLVNASTAAGLTEAMGWLAVEHFQGKHIGDFIFATFVNSNNVPDAGQCADVCEESEEALSRFQGDEVEEPNSVNVG